VSAASSTVLRGAMTSMPQATRCLCVCQYMRTHDRAARERVPSKGDRVELLEPRIGVRLRGTVFYSDQLQILVKWDNGRSQSLRPGVDRFRIIGGEV
jgi:Domain of unknown function (DUF4314)